LLASADARRPTYSGTPQEGRTAAVGRQHRLVAAVDKLKGLGTTVAAKTLKLDRGGLLTQFNVKGELFGGRRQDPADRQRQ